DGRGAPTTDSLESTDLNAFKYDAQPQIDACIDLVASAYKKAADDSKTLLLAVDAFLASPSDETLKAARAAWVDARPAYLKTETFRFYDGPIEEVEGGINSWPMNESYIDYVEGKPESGIINYPKLKLYLD